MVREPRAATPVIRVGLRTCLWRREETARRCLRHYDRLAPQLERVGIQLVMVAVHSGDDAYVQRVRGDTTRWRFLYHVNQPLREKLRAGLRALRGEDLLFAMNIGGDDFIGGASFERIAKEFQAGADFVGWGTAYIAHAQKGVRFWPGYQNHRRGEPFGPGRCLSMRLLQALDWDPWRRAPHRNMDGIFWRRVRDLCPDADVRVLPAQELGPIVDVKDAGSFSPWHTTARYNRRLTWEEAHPVLRQVGLGDLRRR